MPLPKLPTRMGAVISADTGSEPVVAEDAATPAPTPAAKAPRSKAPAAAPAARKTAKPLLPATPPPPEPALTVVTSRPAKKARLATAKRKLFVLDTNVLLHDSNSLFKFQEHDIFLPMMVLEELDHQKKSEERRVGKEWRSWWS